MDVVVWLLSLGLGKYEAAFRENDIDETVLPNLTAEGLKELGIASLGHRRKVLDAIAALRADGSVGQQPLAAALARPSGATPTSPPVAEAVGERRHVTVMFLVRPASLRSLVPRTGAIWSAPIWGAASAAVTEMGGHVAKKLGDELMALFGYPVAQENDAERAARTALSIQSALGEINRKSASSGKPALNARIGIETGLYGDAPNMAARVQALADPDTVVVMASQSPSSLAKRPSAWAAALITSPCARAGNSTRRQLKT